jgi:hypothetical protein
MPLHVALHAALVWVGVTVIAGGLAKEIVPVFEHVFASATVTV